MASVHETSVLDIFNRFVFLLTQVSTTSEFGILWQHCSINKCKVENHLSSTWEKLILVDRRATTDFTSGVKGQRRKEKGRE